MSFDVETVRREFPALNETFGRGPAVFFDNPGGTQVHGSVIEAMRDYLVRRNANVHGAFETSRRTDSVLAEAHRAGADLLGCDPVEVVFGNNMTSLTFAMSRSLAAGWSPGDEIVVTRLDHDANITPWALAAQDTGAVIRWADIEPGTCALDMDQLRALLSRKTKLVAVGYASNATGSINDIAAIIAWSRECGALSFIDAVQYAPHGSIDVRELDCDFLACSAYKFFGPHAGLLFGKRDHLERLPAYKVRPADDEPPGRWETGTQNHEGLAGVTASIDYLASLGSRFGNVSGNQPRREQLREAWRVIREYETELARRLLAGLRSIRGVRIYGLEAEEDLGRRVATVSLRKEGTDPSRIARILGEENLFCWAGNFYALDLSERLGVEERGGFLRLGLVHYNTTNEIDRCLDLLDRI
jgi:cysteine desulfurase family protein (TIGR01976 family)